MSLPPGQRAEAGFPRFGTHLDAPPPRVPSNPDIEITGAVRRSEFLEPDELRQLPRRELTADLHCVAGWSATGLRWEGGAFATFYRLKIEPLLGSGSLISQIGFRGLDGYDWTSRIEDALDESVLLADRLNGRPLEPVPRRAVHRGSTAVLRSLQPRGRRQPPLSPDQPASAGPGPEGGAPPLHPRPSSTPHLAPRHPTHQGPERPRDGTMGNDVPGRPRS